MAKTVKILSLKYFVLYGLFHCERLLFISLFFCSVWSCMALHGIITTSNITMDIDPVIHNLLVKSKIFMPRRKLPSNHTLSYEITTWKVFWDLYIMTENT